MKIILAALSIIAVLAFYIPVTSPGCGHDDPFNTCDEVRK